MILTYKYRVKNTSSSFSRLNRMASAVNYVWNYCNDTSYNQIKTMGRWLSKYDLNNLTTGCSKELGIAAQTVQSVCEEYVKKRIANKKSKLNWRSKKSLGWIPMKKAAIKYNNGEIIYNKETFKVWEDRAPRNIKCGSFNQDSRGRWYLNLVVEVEETPINKEGDVGVDLGLKSTATYSNGEVFEGRKPIRVYADKLAMAQRANKKKLVKKIHSKILNIRKDSLHKETTMVAKKYGLVVVGDVSSKKLMKTRMAKSVSDVAWNTYKTLLAYKTIRFGGELKVVKESWTSRACSNCGNVADWGGLSGLSVREWTCGSCGVSHLRDVNAAINILRIGCDMPFKGVLNTRNTPSLR